MKTSTSPIATVTKITNLIIDFPSETISSHEIANLIGKKLSSVHSDIQVFITQCYGIPNTINFVPEVKQVVKGVKMDFDEWGYITAFYLDKTHALALVLGCNLSKVDKLLSSI